MYTKSTKYGSCKTTKTFSDFPIGRFRCTSNRNLPEPPLTAERVTYPTVTLHHPGPVQPAKWTPYGYGYRAWVCLSLSEYPDRWNWHHMYDTHHHDNLAWLIWRELICIICVTWSPLWECKLRFSIPSSESGDSVVKVIIVSDLFLFLRSWRVLTGPISWTHPRGNKQRNVFVLRWIKQVDMKPAGQLNQPGCSK